MTIKPFQKVDFPEQFPSASDIRQLSGMAERQQGWWYEVRRILQSALEDIRLRRNRFDVLVPNGTTAVSLGNAPAESTTPHAWVEIVAPDGTPCVMPIWKKE